MTSPRRLRTDHHMPQKSLARDLVGRAAPGGAGRPRLDRAAAIGGSAPPWKWDSISMEMIWWLRRRSRPRSGSRRLPPTGRAVLSRQCPRLRRPQQAERHLLGGQARVRRCGSGSPAPAGAWPPQRGLVGHLLGRCSRRICRTPGNAAAPAGPTAAPAPAPADRKRRWAVP